MKILLFAGCFLFLCGFINPLTSVNYACIFPINVALLPSIGSSGNPGADRIDSSRSRTYPSPICICPSLLPPIPGIPFGMSTPGHIMETSSETFKFPSLGIMKGGGFYRMGGGDKPTDINNDSFMHGHIHKFSILALLDLFQDIICLKQPNVFDILYLSEIDPVANSSGTATLLYPETVLLANPIVAVSCAADAVATLVGATIEGMYWCAGGHAVFPMSNFTSKSTSLEDSSSIIMVKMMYRMNRISLGQNFGMTAGGAAIAASSCKAPPLPSPLIIKSQFRTQTTFPVAGMCERLGTPPIKWNTPKRSITDGSMVNILWTREDCCAL